MGRFDGWNQEQLDRWSVINNPNNEDYIGNDEDDGIVGNDVFINDMD